MSESQCDSRGKPLATNNGRSLRILHKLWLFRHAIGDIVAGMSPDPRIDAIIAKAQPFARPILSHLRGLAHVHCPNGEEDVKWGMFAITYKRVILCFVGAFKTHVTFGFWYNKMVTGGTGHEDSAMGSFGKIKSLADLPSDIDLARMIRTSVELIDAGVKPPQFDKPAKSPKPEATVPTALAAALVENHAAQSAFNAFAPGQRREYCEWIADAKRAETRDKRIAQAVEWIAEGKTRNWKYVKC